MNKETNDAISNLYSEHIKKQFNDFRNKHSNEIRQKNYATYLPKCVKELTEINTAEINTECYNIQDKIQSKIEEINEIKTKLQNNLNSPNLTLQNENLKENYMKLNNDLRSSLLTILSQIEILNQTSSIDSVKKWKTDYKDKNDNFLIQPWMNSWIEKRKFLGLVMREKESKLKTVEEKKLSKNEIMQKMERLKQEYQNNTERMENEWKCNENIQLEIDELRKQKCEINEIGGRLTAGEKVQIQEEYKWGLESDRKEIEFFVKVINDKKEVLRLTFQKFIAVVIWIRITMNSMKEIKDKITADEINAVNESILKEENENQKILADFNELVNSCESKLRSEEEDKAVYECYLQRWDMYKNIVV